MKAQSGLKFSSEMCFGIINTKKDSYLLNYKVAFLKRGQNAAGICPFFLWWQANAKTFYLVKKEQIEQLPCELFLQGFEFSCAYLPPVSHIEGRGEFQNPIKVVLISLSL